LAQFVNRAYLPKSVGEQPLLLPARPNHFTAVERPSHPFLEGAFEELYPAFLEVPSLQEALSRLTSLAEDYGGLVNDLVSVLKELKEGSLFNLVALVWGNTKFNTIETLVTAVNEVGLLNQAIFAEAQQLYQQIMATIEQAPSHYNPELKRKQQILAIAYYHICLATYHWQVSKDARPRYQENAKGLYQEFAE
jgi:hypothetical protein